MLPSKRRHTGEYVEFGRVCWAPEDRFLGRNGFFNGLLARIIHEARPKSPQDVSCCVVATDSILDGVYGPDCGRIGPAALPDTPWNNLDSTFMNSPG